MNTEKNSKLTKTLGNVAFYALLLFLLINGFTAKQNSEIPSFFGYSFMHVISASMEPYIMTDDIAIGKAVDTDEEIIIGETYIYEAIDKTKIIHRVIKQNLEGEYIFKGDNNKIADIDPVDRSQIEIKYLFRIPYLGKVVKLFKNSFFYAIILGGYFAFEIVNFVKNKRQANTTKED